MPAPASTIEPYVLRPGEGRDLPALKRLLTLVIGGMTTLPNEDSFLEAKLQQSETSFAQKVKVPGAEQYFFVLEDARTRELVGTSAIMARVGGYDPFYSYQVRREQISHAPLAIEREMAVLHLKTSHKGPSEICSLFLNPKLRASGLGRLLSLGRFLFMAAFPARFDAEVIAELRGYLDDNNRSPFWDSVGRHFFQDDFHAADVLSGLGEKDFIRDLMPRHPIYVPLLPPDVQAVVGRVHRETEPAKRLLLDEGFAETDEVDIFDAGPLVRAKRERIRTIQQRKLTTVRALHPKSPPGATRALMANTSLNFRSCLGMVRINSDASVDLDAATAKRLQLAVGDEIQFLSLGERKKAKT
jgi:arginine N-succinyltransferase